jgi:hypothetical protein
MKKIIFLLVMTVFAIGCKVASTTETKVDSKNQSAMRGNWTITAVTFIGQDYMKVSSFDLADSQCFVGSNWSFVANNNTGNFALNSPSCTGFSSPITWYLNKEGNFVMKILNETKSKKVVDGYILTVQNQTASSFELVDKINVGGKLTNITYKFQKAN